MILDYKLSSIKIKMEAPKWKFYAESLMFQSPHPSNLPIPYFENDHNSPHPSNLPIPYFENDHNSPPSIEFTNI